MPAMSTNCQINCCSSLALQLLIHLSPVPQQVLAHPLHPISPHRRRALRVWILWMMVMMNSQHSHGLICNQNHRFSDKNTKVYIFFKLLCTYLWNFCLPDYHIYIYIYIYMVHYICLIKLSYYSVSVVQCHFMTMSIC